MEIPRNIRQIGDIEKNIRLYIEDYVATYMEKQKHRSGTSIGVLLGTQGKENGVPCLFIRGAVLAKDYELEAGRVYLTAQTWNGVYEETGQYFKEVEICGWFLCSADSELTDLYHLQKSHSENFKGKNQILFLYDGDRDEEAVYSFDGQGAHRLRGYYIYYERNEQMQEYMIAKEPARKTEYTLAPVPRGTEDRAAKQFRAIMETKQEKKTEKNGITRFLRTVSVAALLCGAGFGAAAWYRYDGMKGLKEAAAVLAGREQVQTDGQESAEESGQAVIREVPGGVLPTESSSESTGTEPAGQTAGESTGAPGQASEAAAGTEPSAGETGNLAETEGSRETAGESTSSAAEPQVAPAYREYTVKNGDTLYQICKELYGYGSDSLLKEICELNNMENADYIYEGQLLRLPE